MMNKYIPSITDILFGTGLLALTAGTWAALSWPIALVTAGTILISVSLFSKWRGYE